MARRFLLKNIFGYMIFLLSLKLNTANAAGLSLKELLERDSLNDHTQISSSIADPILYDRVHSFPPLKPFRGGGGDSNSGGFTSSTDSRFNAIISNQIATNVLDLAHDISKTLLEESNEKTEVFSPLSIFGALNLLLLGSSGQTFNELMKLMRFNTDSYLSLNPWKIHEEFGILIDDVTRDSKNPQHPRPQNNWKLISNPGRNSNRQNSNNNNPNDNVGKENKITIANGMFVQKDFSIRPDYRNAVLGTYKSNMQSLDFENNISEATKYINDWVNLQTEGKIPEIVSNSLSPYTKVVLASALYFNAAWEKTFIEGATSPRDFYPDGLEHASITVNMMAHGGHFPYYDAKEFDCRILGLPYKNNLTTMYIIIPNNSNRLRLRQMQEYLTADKIENMISKMEWKTAIVLLPKMHISNQINLKRILQKMNVQSLFDRGTGDLSLMSTGQEGQYGDNNSGYSAGAFQPPPLPPLQPQTQEYYPSMPLPSPSLSLSPSQEPFPAPKPYDNNFKFYMSSLTADDADEQPFIFSRHGEDDDDDVGTQNTTTTTTTKSNTKSDRKKRDVTYKVPSEYRRDYDNLRLKDYIISKRINKLNPGKKHARSRRNTNGLDGDNDSLPLKNLDQLRNQLQQNSNRHQSNPRLFAEEIVHKIDLTINEKGTEGGAATVTYLYRTGTDTVFRVETPFILLLRHDDTKLPLFYGTVYEPTDY